MAKKAYIGVDGVARKVKKGYIGIDNVIPRFLPSGYTQVAYLESSGEQYINTGFYPNQDTRTVMRVTVSQTGEEEYLFGVRMPTTAMYEFHRWSNAFSIGYNSGWVDLGSYDGIMPFTIDFNKNLAYFNGALALSATYATFSCSYPMYLFQASGDHGFGGMSAKLYDCHIYDNGTLVRDYVPCINREGTAGLYDLVNGVFYTNAGTGAFSIGGTKESVARKIRKAYIGIGGVARPCWSGGELAYYGTINDLSVARFRLSATSNSTHAIFAGGDSDNTTSYAIVDAYDSSLTRKSAPNLSSAREALAAATAGDYAVFGGGNNGGSTVSSVVDAYDSSLTRKSAIALKSASSHLAATSIGSYALFGGGYEIFAGTNTANVTAYSNSLAQNTPSVLSTARRFLASASVGNYALFGGGGDDNRVYSTMDAYNSSLTKVTAPTLSTARWGLSATSVGDYALFGGGANNYGGYLKTVDAINTSLTRTTATELSVARYCIYVANLGGFALFGGGSYGATNIVDVYDTSLTKTVTTSLSVARANDLSCSVAPTVGDYALFGGGTNGGGVFYKTVDAYTIA